MTDTETAVPTDRVAVARGVTRSVVFQLVAKIAHVLLNVVSSLAIIRYLAPAAFGDYALVVSLVTLFGILCDFGIDKFGIREISLDGHTEAEVTGTVVVVRLALSIVSFILVQAALFALDRNAHVHLAAAVASGLFVIQALLTLGIAFAVRIEQQFDALSQLAGEVVETAFTLWLVASGATLVELFTAPVVGGAVAVLLTITLTRRRYRSRVRFARARIAPLLRGSFPIAMAGVVGIVLLRLDTLMLAVLYSSKEVGIYGAAYQPLQYVLIANVALVAIVLPLLSRYHATDADRFLSTYRRGTEAILAFILPVALDPGGRGRSRCSFRVPVVVRGLRRSLAHSLDRHGAPHTHRVGGHRAARSRLSTGHRAIQRGSRSRSASSSTASSSRSWARRVPRSEPSASPRSRPCGRPRSRAGSRAPVSTGRGSPASSSPTHPSPPSCSRSRGSASPGGGRSSWR